MRELKGDWRDLFNGFMLALDLRKMFLALCAILFTVFGPLAVTCWIGNEIDREFVQPPETFVLGEIYRTVCQSWHVIYSGSPGHEADWKVYVPYSILFLVAVFAIWAYFGGAIARIAAYEIAKDGERIETARALRFAGRKFWSFFMSPWICVIGFLFFFLCNVAGGAIGRLVDLAYIGGPLVAVLLPLALLSGFIMTLIVVGTLAGFPLFTPAVAAEGTDAFDAVSRGFSYVYSRPWQYVWCQLVAGVYGIVCISFVILFSITLCHIGLTAGAAGFDAFLIDEAPSPPSDPKDTKAWEKYRADKRDNPDLFRERYDKFSHVTDTAWAMILSQDHAVRDYDWSPVGVATRPTPYGRLMYLSNRIVKPNHSMRVDALKTKWHKIAAWIVMAWLVIALGLALGYVPSYVISQQTLIYCILRKKVDGIEMNEVYEEPEEERMSEPGAPPSVALDKPPPPPPAPAPSGDKPADAKPPEPPKPA